MILPGKIIETGLFTMLLCIVIARVWPDAKRKPDWVLFPWGFFLLSGFLAVIVGIFMEIWK